MVITSTIRGDQQYSQIGLGMEIHGTKLYFKNVLPEGPGSVVGIATALRAGRSGYRIPVGSRFSAPVQTGPEAQPASCTMGTGSFPWVRCGRGVTLTPHPRLVPRSKIQ